MYFSPPFMRHSQSLGVTESAAGHLCGPNDFLHTCTTPSVITGRLLETLIHLCRHTQFYLHLINHEDVPEKSNGSACGTLGNC